MVLAFTRYFDASQQPSDVKFLSLLNIMLCALKPLGALCVFLFTSVLSHFRLKLLNIAKLHKISIMDESWSLGTAEMLQQIGTLTWAMNDDKAPKMVENLTAMRIGYELYQRLSGQRDVDALRNQTIMAIAKFVKDHPKASKEELTKEISKQIALFAKRLEEI